MFQPFFELHMTFNYEKVIVEGAYARSAKVMVEYVC